MDHAHGSSPPDSVRGRPSLVGRATPSPTPTYTRLTSNQKRLQARHSGFTGTPIASPTVRGRLAQLFHGNEENSARRARTRLHENTGPGHSNMLGAPSDHRFGLPFNILTEMTNSTSTPHRPSPKRTSAAGWVDEWQRPLLERSPATPLTPLIFHDAPSSPLSPGDDPAAHAGSDAMPLRSLSGNAGRVSWSGSAVLASSLKGTQNRTVKLRQASLEASTYIDHLEHQLQMTQEQLNSPRTGEPLEDKVKVLKVENKQLRNTISDLEESCERRVKSAVQHLTAVEGEYMRKIHGLEDELESKQITLEEYQQDVQHAHATVAALKATVDRLEEDRRRLEDDNRGLAKRNEVFAGLLALSPPKPGGGSAWNSPTRDTPKAPRPQSMMLTRFPTSPTAKHATRPPSTVVSPAHSSCSYFSPRSALEREHEHPGHGATHRDRQKSHGDSDSRDSDARDSDARDSDARDSGRGDSGSVPSGIHSTSRRSTLASPASVSPSAGGWPLPGSPTDDAGTVKQHHRRKPRRFMSGSTQLKPLLLPSMNADVNSAFPPALIPSPLTLSRRDVSDQSLDPTTSFISSPQDCGTPVDSPGRARRDCRGATWPSSQDRSEEAEDESDVVSPAGRFVERMDTVWTSEQPSFIDSTDTEDDDHSVMSYASRWGHPSDVANSVGGLFISCGTEQPGRPDTEDPSGLDTARRGCEDETETRCGSSGDEFVLRAENMSTVALVTPAHESTEAAPMHPKSPASHRDEHLGRTSNRLTGSKPSSIRRKRRRSSSSSEEVGRSPRRPLPPSDPTSPAGPSPGSDNVLHELVRVTPSTRIVDVVAGRQVGPPKSRCRSPIETWQTRNIIVQPLVSATVHTIYGTVSRYTSHLRAFQRDPWALARKIIANAWCTNWKRFGKLSWWVLGLFLRSSTRLNTVDQGCRAQTPHGQHVTYDDTDPGYRTRAGRKVAQPVLETERHTSRGWGQSLYLWGKFSLAIMLAVGGAVLQGPAEMMKDCDEHTATPRSSAATSHPPPRHHPEALPCQDPSLDVSMDGEPGPWQPGDRPAPEYQASAHAAKLQRPRAPSESQRVFTFGAPAIDHGGDGFGGFDGFNDNGGARPCISRDPDATRAPDEVGTRRWMPSLDSHDVSVIDAADRLRETSSENSGD